MRLLIDDITADARLQHRPMSEGYVATLCDLIDDGVELPEVSIIREGQALWLYDGFHRYAAAKRKKHNWINANVYDGDFRAAWKASLGVNEAHGLRRTAEDIHAILAKCFVDAEVSQMPDRGIARLTNVHHSTVAKFRKHLEEATAASAQENFSALGTPPSDDPSSSDGSADAASYTPDEKKAMEVKKEWKKCQKAFNQLVLSLEVIGIFDRVRLEMARIKEVANLF